MLEDIAILTGGEVITSDLGLELKDVQIEQLGRAKQVKSTKRKYNNCRRNGRKKKEANRVKQIKTQIEETTSSYDKEGLQERLAKIAGGVAVIEVGAATEVEMKDRKLRIEDALSATKAAVEEGIVAGGGNSFNRCYTRSRKICRNIRRWRKIRSKNCFKSIRRTSKTNSCKCRIRTSCNSRQKLNNQK